MKPLTIVVSFDVGEQVVPGGIAGWVASQVHEFRFQSAEAAFDRCIVPAISLPAHGLDHPGHAENLAVIGGGVLAAAIGMVAGRRLFCRRMAMVRAAVVNSARRWPRIAQPTILRVKRSSTTAK